MYKMQVFEIKQQNSLLPIIKVGTYFKFDSNLHNMKIIQAWKAILDQQFFEN